MRTTKLGAAGPEVGVTGRPGLDKLDATDFRNHDRRPHGDNLDGQPADHARHRPHRRR